MKKYFWFLIALFLAMADLYAGSNDDMIWTKIIWPENVLGVMFNHNEMNEGRSLVFVSTNAQVRIYDTETGDSIGVVKGVGAFRYYSPDKRFIYTSTLLKLDAQTFQVVARYDTIGVSSTLQMQDMGITPDGKYVIAVFHTPYIISPDKFSNNIALYSGSDMHFIKTLSCDEDLRRIAISNDGKFIVTLSDKSKDVYTAPFRYILTLWDSKTLETIKTIYQDTISPGIIKFTPDSKYFVTAYRNVLFYETENFSLSKKTNGTEGFVFTMDSRYVITTDGADNSLCVYNIADGILKYQYKGGADIYVDISPDQNYIIDGGGYGFALYQSKLVGIPENSIKKQEVSIYPNPGTGMADITFNNSLSGNYRVEIFNNSGILINKLFNGFLDTGNHEFQLNTGNYTNGIYFCKITSSKTNLTYKIIISK